MADHQHDSLPSNLLLGPRNEGKEMSVDSPARQDSHLLSQPSSRDEAEEKSAHQQVAEHHSERLIKGSSLKLWWTDILSIIFSLSCLMANEAYWQL